MTINFLTAPHQTMPPPGRPLGNSMSSNSPSANQSGKRASRTPIIIIPGATNSLITMFNAKDILQDLRSLSLLIGSIMKTDGNLINVKCLGSYLPKTKEQLWERNVRTNSLYKDVKMVV